MTVISPAVEHWLEKGLVQGEDWNYFTQMTRRPVPLRAGQEIALPENTAMLEAPWGTLFNFNAGFTSDECGIRFEMIDLDTARNVVIVSVFQANLIFSNTSTPFVSSYSGAYYSVDVPGVPIRVFTINMMKELSFQRYMRLYLFNRGDEAAACLRYAILGAKLYTSGAKRLGLPCERGD